jgi:hypothetical protein
MLKRDLYSSCYNSSACLIKFKRADPLVKKKRADPITTKEQPLGRDLMQTCFSIENVIDVKQKSS